MPPRQEEHFVGRRAERAAFRAALRQGARLVYVFGPGGIGKTTLLRILAGECRAARVPAALLDARDIEPAPGALLAAIAGALSLPAGVDPFVALSRLRKRRVLFIDTFERIRALDDWFRDELSARCSPELLLVPCGRDAPGTAWRALPGWGRTLRPLPLRNLSPRESEELLRARGVPRAERRPLLAFARGHPLALALASDALAQRPNLDFGKDAAAGLARNPLLSSRLVRSGLAPSAVVAERAERLRSVFEEAVAELGADPRLTPSANALEATYLRAFERQEVAAERLGIPFSTYRRHLRRGLLALTERLWQRELGA